MLSISGTRPLNFTSQFNLHNSHNKKKASLFHQSEQVQDNIELSSSGADEPKTSENSFLKRVGSKATVLFNQIKTAIRPDEPEVLSSVKVEEPEFYDDIDLKAEVIKALDEQGKLIHLVAKIGLDEVYDYVTGVDHDKLTTRYMAMLGKEQFEYLSHYYCLYTTAYNLVELLHGDASDSKAVINKIKYLKKYISTH